MSARIEWGSGFHQRMNERFHKKQKFVDSECIRLMQPLTPRRSGALIRSATLGTVIGSGKIVQQTPYARRQYFEHKEKAQWFERMKARHKAQILKGAENI